MGKVLVSQEKARQILVDAEINLEKRLADSVGEDNYNRGPVNDALNAVDMQIGRLGARQTYEFGSSGYPLDTLLDRELRRPVKRVLNHIKGVSVFPSPDSIRYSTPELKLGLDDVAAKWALSLEPLKPLVERVLERDVMIHDLNGFRGNGFNEFRGLWQEYLDEFHSQTKPLMEQRAELERTRGTYAKIGSLALGGAVLGVGAGYFIDAKQFYNFYTQLLLARFPVAMLESAAIAADPITGSVKRLLHFKQEEPVVKMPIDSLASFVKWNLAGPPTAVGMSIGGEVTGLNSYQWIDGIINVENNNVNNQAGLIPVYGNYVRKYGKADGTKRFLKDPFVIGNLVITGAYFAYAILGRMSGSLKVDTGVESGGEAGFISADTFFATALAMGIIYTKYLIKHNRMLGSGIRGDIYRNISRS